MPATARWWWRSLTAASGCARTSSRTSTGGSPTPTTADDCLPGMGLSWWAGWRPGTGAGPAHRRRPHPGDGHRAGGHREGHRGDRRVTIPAHLVTSGTGGARRPDQGSRSALAPAARGEGSRRSWCRRSAGGRTGCGCRRRRTVPRHGQERIGPGNRPGDPAAGPTAIPMPALGGSGLARRTRPGADPKVPADRSARRTTPRRLPPTGRAGHARTGRRSGQRVRTGGTTARRG